MSEVVNHLDFFCFSDVQIYVVSLAPLEGIVDWVEVWCLVVVVYQSQYRSVIGVFDDVAVLVR